MNPPLLVALDTTIQNNSGSGIPAQDFAVDLLRQLADNLRAEHVRRAKDRRLREEEEARMERENYNAAMGYGGQG